MYVNSFDAHFLIVDCKMLFETKIAIAVKLCFIETRLKQAYDLQGYFLKIAREAINLFTIVVIIIFLIEHLLEAVVQSDETVGSKCSRVKGKEKYVQMTLKNKFVTWIIGYRRKHEIGLQPCNFLKKRLQHSYFPVEFGKLSKTGWLLLKTHNILHNKKLCRALISYL